MPVHDWNRVEAGIFHDFHTAWIPLLRTALNNGVLPAGYYALAEQHAGQTITDVLTLHASPAPAETPPWPPISTTGGLALAQAPPKVRHHHTVPETLLARRRTLAIRHVSGHRLVALLEILSPANKDRAASVAAFANKVVQALDAGVHVLLVDLFAPGPHDSRGMHAEILGLLDHDNAAYAAPAAEPVTLASYAAGPNLEIFVEQVALGVPLPDMPLFLRFDRYVQTPLEATYLEAYRGVPSFWRSVIEGKDADHQEKH